MRSAAAPLALVAILAACSAPAPNDGEQYFDNITPDPSALAAEEERLALAENTSNVKRKTTTVIPPADQKDTGISQTQEFAVVSEAETIESDAAKLAALKDAYQVVEPKAAPTREGNVNLAAYAISQKQAVGTKVYSRFPLGVGGCGRYRSDPDAAQRAFLQAGGPEKDRKRLDPDGDGFACDWNPETYRRLLAARESG